MALLAAVTAVAALLSVTPGAADTGAADTAQPAVVFADTEYFVPFLGRMFNETTTPGGNPGLPGTVALSVSTNKFNYFGELEMQKRSGTDLDLSFKVEGQPDASNYRYCRQDRSTCHNTEVRVLPDKGLLYLWNSGNTDPLHWLATFEPERLEVSAADTGTGLKVYREVLVNPPPEVQGCEDYDDYTIEAYVCLYLREIIPEEARGGNEATLRAGLPGLVQDSSNYQLVFAEEFDGSPPAANFVGCRDGLSTLDDSVWNYGNACAWVDSRGESCGNIADGSLKVAAAYKCYAGLNTFGKVQYKYGYLEFKYTVNMDYWSNWPNYNLIAWNPHNWRKHLWNQYGVPMNDWEDYLKYGDVELDWLEYVPGSRHQSSIVHANWAHSSAGNLPSYKIGTNFNFCRRTSNPYHRFYVNPAGGCRRADTFTVTMGVEWTPRGYRTYTTLDGIHDEQTLVTEQYLEIMDFKEGRTAQIPEGDRARYFEYLDPDDPSTILGQVGVAHTPSPLSIGTWGWMRVGQSYIRSWMKIDYIRLWQPENHYSDMEPVYQ